MRWFKESDVSEGTEPGKRHGNRWLSYIPGNSYLHLLDPRTKLIALFLISLTALFLTDLSLMCALWTGIVVLGVMAGLGRPLLRAILVMMPLVFFVVVLDSFFANDPTGIIYYSGQIWLFHPELTSGRIIYGVTMGFRLLSIGCFSALFVMTTDYHTFVNSLRGMRIPRMLSFSLGYGLHSTTALAEDVRNIMDAQRSRGMEFDKSLITKNRNRIMALGIPMTVSVLKRSRHVSEAMQSRGYGKNSHPGCYHPPYLKRIDYWMILALLVFLVLLISLSWIF